MFKDPRQRRIIIAAGAGGVLAIVAAWIFLGDMLFRMTVKPSGSFATQPAPPAPDYSKPENWALRPGLPPPGGWEKPWGVDIFFVHPTSAYAGKDWNAPVNDKAANERLTTRILPNQAGPFLQAGPVYAPRYRQAALYAEIDVGGEGDGAFLLAYSDVLAAFDRYMAVDNRGRGIVLAGVGQGGLYVQKLLIDRFQTPSLRDRLAAAYIIDAAVPADASERMFIQPICDAPSKVQCVVAWRTVIANQDQARLLDASPIWTADGKIAPSKDRPLVCVNPLTWTTGGELAPRSVHRGGAKASGAEDLTPKILPNAISAKCSDGVLEIQRPSAPQLQASGDWGGRYKTPEYNLFYADIVANVTDRARAESAWLDEFGAKPAEPLPPATTLDDQPIHRPTGKPEPVPQDGN